MDESPGAALATAGARLRAYAEPMLEAFGWGIVGASSLLIGAIIGIHFDVPQRIVGLILGFGAGTLISAVAFELTEEAYALGGADTVALGLGLGALTYFAGDAFISARGADGRMSPDGKGAEGGDGSPTPSSALLLGAVLDGIPESAVIGISLLEGGGVGVAVLAAVFLSNLPEALAAASGMRSGPRGTRGVIVIWATVVVVCGISSALGFVLLEGASGNVTGLLQSFAAGAVLTMLADTMFPEAFEHGGKAVGLLTTLGFALAYLLSTL